MSSGLICDGCGRSGVLRKVESAEELGSPFPFVGPSFEAPAGWVYVQTVKPKAKLDFCSWGCLVQYVELKKIEEGVVQ